MGICLGLLNEGCLFCQALICGLRRSLLLIVLMLRFALRRMMSAGGGHRADANAPRIALGTGLCFPPERKSSLHVLRAGRAFPVCQGL